MSVEIRHSRKEDIPGIRDIYAQSSCYAETLQLPYPSIDKWEKFLGNIPENFYSIVAVLDGKIVGQIGMEVFTNPRRKHVSNMGMAVSEEHQQSGVGSKLLEAMLDLAFNWLAIRRVELEVYTDNEKAIGVYEKFGFKVEGTARGYAFRDGKYADVHLMAKVA